MNNFDKLREMNRSDVRDGSITPDVHNTTLAMINIIEEIDNKLERIATALEQLSAALYSYDGRAFVATRTLD